MTVKLLYVLAIVAGLVFGHATHAKHASGPGPLPPPCTPTQICK